METYLSTIYMRTIYQKRYISVCQLIIKQMEIYTLKNCTVMYRECRETNSCELKKRTTAGYKKILGSNLAFPSPDRSGKSSKMTIY